MTFGVSGRGERFVADDPDDRHAAWCEVFKELSGDVQRLHVRSQVYERIDEAIVAQRKEGSALVVEVVLRPMYAEAQAMAVRRLADAGRRHRSLLRLLNDMAQRPTVLSRRQYVAHFQRPNDPDFLTHGDDEFDRLAGHGAKHFPKRKLVELSQELIAVATVVKTYVDEQIAHAASGSTATLTFGQLKDAIHKVSGIYQQIGVVLNATHYEYEPVIQVPWEGVFSEGLFPEDRS
jgi:hypothetical protein